MGGKTVRKWELYNLKTDIAEAHDLYLSEKDKFKEMMADWDRYAKDNGLILALGNGIGNESIGQPCKKGISE